MIHHLILNMYFSFYRFESTYLPLCWNCPWELNNSARGGCLAVGRSTAASIRPAQAASVHHRDVLKLLPIHLQIMLVERCSRSQRNVYKQPFFLQHWRVVSSCQTQWPEQKLQSKACNTASNVLGVLPTNWQMRRHKAAGSPKMRILWPCLRFLQLLSSMYPLLWAFLGPHAPWTKTMGNHALPSGHTGQYLRESVFWMEKVCTWGGNWCFEQYPPTRPHKSHSFPWTLSVTATSRFATWTCQAWKNANVYLCIDSTYEISPLPYSRCSLHPEHPAR